MWKWIHYSSVWVTSAEIPYWWHVTTQILVVLLIGWNAREYSLKLCSMGAEIKVQKNQTFRGCCLFFSLETSGSLELIFQRPKSKVSSYIVCFSALFGMVVHVLLERKCLVLSCLKYWRKLQEWPNSARKNKSWFSWKGSYRFFPNFAYKLCRLSSSDNLGFVIKCLTSFRDIRHYLKWGAVS